MKYAVDFKVINNIKVSENFKLSEFQCPCCYRAMIHPELLRRLQLVRTNFNSPIRVTSGYRCPLYNIRKEGAVHSKHLIGEEVDIIAIKDDLFAELVAVVEAIIPFGEHSANYTEQYIRLFLTDKEGVTE